MVFDPIVKDTAGKSIRIWQPIAEFTKAPAHARRGNGRALDDGSLHGGRQPHSQQGLGEGQREHGGIAIDRAINRRFGAVRVEQGQGAAVYQLGGQGDPHLAGSLGKLAAVDVAHGQQPFAALQRAQAQQRLAIGDSAADDLDGSVGQRRLGAVAHRAAHGAEGDIQRRQLDDLTIDRLFMVAAAAQALRALRAVAVGRPLAIPVAAVRHDGIGVAIRAAGAGVQGVAVILAGARDHLSRINLLLKLLQCKLAIVRPA